MKELAWIISARGQGSQVPVMHCTGNGCQYNGYKSVRSIEITISIGRTIYD